MGLLLAFAVGYAIGARAGEQGYGEVVDALKAVRESEEFQSLLAAGRTHVGAVLSELGARLSDDDGEGLSVDAVVARARNLLASAIGPTSPES